MSDETHDHEVTLVGFLDAAAAKRADPGGGAVAGVAGALAASMGAMALRYSLRKKDAPHHDDHREAIEALDAARAELTTLIDADQAAYAALVEARKAHREDDVPLAQVHAAARAAVDVPLKVVAAAGRVLDVAAEVAGSCNGWLLSDLGVCCDLAAATVRCGVWNVLANAGDLSAADRTRALADAEAARAAMVGRVTAATGTIRRRMNVTG